MGSTDLSELAVPGARIAVRVTPRASRDRVERAADGLRIYTTSVPENGKANAQVTKLLAKALGLPKSRLKLIRGTSARDKLFEIVG